MTPTMFPKFTVATAMSIRDVTSHLAIFGWRRWAGPKRAMKMVHIFLAGLLLATPGKVKVGKVKEGRGMHASPAAQSTYAVFVGCLQSIGSDGTFRRTLVGRFCLTLHP